MIVNVNCEKNELQMIAFLGLLANMRLKFRHVLANRQRFRDIIKLDKKKQRINY